MICYHLAILEHKWAKNEPAGLTKRREGELSMNNSQITVQYRVEHENFVDYSGAESVYEEEEEFSIRMEEGRVYFVMKCNCPTVQSAKEVVEPYIDNWGLHVALTGRPGQFKLTFEKAEIKDLRTGSVEHYVDAGPAHWQFSIPVIPGPYPRPPKGVSLKRSDDVELMFNLYEAFYDDREKLTGIAYFCLTMLEKLAGGSKHGGRRKRMPKRREEASSKFKIKGYVLNEVAYLSSEKGGKTEARKADGAEEGFDLTEDERTFLENAVMMSIRRVAEEAHSPGKAFEWIK